MSKVCEINEIEPSLFIYDSFWTSKQRDAHSLHEVSYRACFKPALPKYFIERYSKKGDLIYDPFMGRGTTILEAHLLERMCAGRDVNPLSQVLVEPRLMPPRLAEIEKRLSNIDLRKEVTFSPFEEELLTFFHPKTLIELLNLKLYFHFRKQNGSFDLIDAWIQMVATNRLTGHSNGFFSVYTLPPNQAVSIKSQKRINQKRNQIPEYRDLESRIIKKSKALLKDVQNHCATKNYSSLSIGDASESALEDNSVQLVVTSPPFLDVVDYKADNWMRAWFNNIEIESLGITQLSSIESWTAKMLEVFLELFCVVKPSGYVAFEVGEVRAQKLKMEELVIPIAQQAGFKVEKVLINTQDFTKTANCWGVSNQSKGTNTNRIVLLRK